MLRFGSYEFDVRINLPVIPELSPLPVLYFDDQCPAGSQHNLIDLIRLPSGLGMAQIGKNECCLVVVDAAEMAVNLLESTLFAGSDKNAARYM